MRSLVLALTLATTAIAQPRVEEGEINGAKFRIDIPENWNGTLLMFCHGYTPVTDVPRANLHVQALTSRGFALAQSGYSATGWAVEEGVRDTESLRAYFVRKYGTPKRTIVGGMSMGGQITNAIIERYPDAYDGALPLCAVMPPAYEFFQRRLFDLRIVFDYYFPAALPAPDEVPVTYRRSDPQSLKLLALLDANPEKAAILRNYMGYRSNRDVAFVTDFMTEILAVLRERTGGNPFDNRATLYEGTPEDNVVNDGVKRYAADPKSAAYLKNHANLTGDLRRPMLEIHTTYDQLVPAKTVNEYTVLVQRSGREENLSVQYIKRDGHCTFKPDEVVRALDQLMVWINEGKKPVSGAF